MLLVTIKIKRKEMEDSTQRLKTVIQQKTVETSFCTNNVLQYIFPGMSQPSEFGLSEVVSILTKMKSKACNNNLGGVKTSKYNLPSIEIDQNFPTIVENSFHLIIWCN